MATQKGQQAAAGMALSRGPERLIGRHRDDACIGKSSTHLMRVGAMSHSGFANFVGEKAERG